MNLQAIKHSLLDEAVERYTRAAGDALESIVLYGPAARGDFYRGERDLHLLLVTRDLALTTLETLADPLSWWLKKGRPVPRIFSPALIADSTDVFPMELTELSEHRVVLYGDDPFTDLEIDRDHLRLQCERELRERMLRLREAFIESRSKSKLLARLMEESYSSFAQVFRGILRLRSDQVPAANAELIDGFCQWAELDAEPFHQIEALKHGRGSGERDLFDRYYQELTKAVAFVDSFVNASSTAEETS